VRVASKKVWHTGGLFALDIDHMPAGCGTWPAFWLVAADCGSGSGACSWPVGGEIDIIEGANKQTRVKSTLHTAGNCKMDPTCPDYPDMSGTMTNAGHCDDMFPGCE
jgi:beta-glucanase (GH16 family)